MNKSDYTEGNDIGRHGTPSQRRFVKGGLWLHAFIAAMHERARRNAPNRGQVVIQDFIMDEDRTAPAFGAFFSLNMLVGTESGDTYTESEVLSWMEDAGLYQVERKDTAFGTTLIIGKK